MCARADASLILSPNHHSGSSPLSSTISARVGFLGFACDPPIALEFFDALWDSHKRSDGKYREVSQEAAASWELFRRHLRACHQPCSNRRLRQKNALVTRSGVRGRW